MVPSFFLTNTMGELHSLLECDINPAVSISFSSVLTVSRNTWGIRYGGNLTGLASPVLILCSASTVWPGVSVFTKALYGAATIFSAVFSGFLLAGSIVI